MIENKEVPMMAMTQEEYESLMMAHDNLQRELVEIKRLMGKDKHALIKSNISLNKKVQELESESYNAHLERLLDRREHQIKRYREAIKKIKLLPDYVHSSTQHVEYINSIIVELEESE